MKMTLCPYCMKEAAGEICSHCGRMVAYGGEPAHLQAGFVLEGIHPYILGASLGQGGFGITYIALDMVTNQRVAIKEYYPTYCAIRTDTRTVTYYRGQEDVYNKGKKRFLDEARMLKSLSDLNSVVNVLDFFEFNNSAYLVMEFVEGDSLKAHALKHGKFPAQEFLTKLRPLMEDLERMHQRGVVHRDIAPDNIIMTPDGQMKLIDFGAARSYVGDKSMTVVVKKGFAPIEQYMRHGSTTATDVYSLAATIYYCITGVVPPDSAERQYDEDTLQSPISLGAELSREQEQAILQALEVQPKMRTQSVAELLKALEHTSEQEEMPTESPKKSIWWIPVAAVLVLCLGAGVLLMGKNQPAAPVQTESAQISTPETVPTVTVKSDVARYNEAVDLFFNGEYGKAAIAFYNLGDFRDAKTISRQIWDALTPEKTIATGRYHTVAVKNDGTVLTVGWIHGDAGKELPIEGEKVSKWRDIVSITAGDYHTVGLKNDGTVIATGLNTSSQCDVSHWTDIIDVVAGETYTAGLKSDGTVVYAGSIPNAEVIDTWENIVSIAGERFTLAGLKADGSALFSNQPDLIIQNIIGLAVISNGDRATIMEDGTVILSNGTTYNGEFDSVFGGGHVILAIQDNGTVITDGTYHIDNNILTLDDWADLKGTDIVSFDASYGHAIILKKDGTVSAYGDHRDGRCDVGHWKNIRLPADRDALLDAIELDYITEE